jgi:hypothetical protein
MDILSHTTYLIQFAAPEALRSWSPAVRAELAGRLVNEPPSEAAWGAFLELLFHWPVAESIVPVVTGAATALRTWDWRIRHAGHRDAVLSRDGGIAMTLVGRLELRAVEDLHGLAIGALCSHPYLDGVRGLQLYKVETFPQHVGALVGCPALSGLESLQLFHVGLSGGIDKAFGISTLEGLKSLGLGSADLVRGDLEALAQTPPSSVIERLDLSGNFLNSADIGVLLNADSFPRLQVLDLSNTWLTNDDFDKVVAARRLPALEKIILSGTAPAKRFGNELLL